MRVLMFFATLWLALLSGASAQIVVPELTPAQEQAAVAAMSQLRSPVTPFHTVDMCPSVPALRDSIRVAAATGMTTEQLVEDVISRHGEELRLLPKRSGVGLLAWIATPLLLLAGAGLIAARLLRGQSAATERADTEAASTLSEAERARIASAFDEWRDEGEVEP